MSVLVQNIIANFNLSPYFANSSIMPPLKA